MTINKLSKTNLTKPFLSESECYANRQHQRVRSDVTQVIESKIQEGTEGRFGVNVTSHGHKNLGDKKHTRQIAGK